MRGWLVGGLVIASAQLAGADDYADAEAHVPGFVNDPVSASLAERLAVRTRDGYSLEGGTPSEGVVWLDEFAVPGFHRDGRGAFTLESIDHVLITNDVTVDAGTTGAGLVAATSNPEKREYAGEVSTRDLIAVARGDYQSVVVRTSLLGFAAPLFVPNGRELTIDDAPNSQDVLVHSLWRKTGTYVLYATAFATRDQLAYFTDRTEHADHRVEDLRDAGRATVVLDYQHDGWRASSAQSISEGERRFERGLVQHERINELAFDTRELLAHTLSDVAGLARVRWTASAEAHVTRHDLDLAAPEDHFENVARAGLPAIDDVSHTYRNVVWTPDAAGAVAVDAVLDNHLDLYAGVRVDAFGSDVAIEPRAALTARLPDDRTVRLEAGAYRRGAEHGEELEHPELHPERTTRISLETDQQVGTWAYEAELYYADRTHLIERDGNGILANTGNGTTYGAYGFIARSAHHWVGQLAVRLEHDDRQDAPRSIVRPFEFSQPIRLQARLTRFVGGWQFGARFELREGLPYTAVAGDDYQSDRDVYTPHFGALYGERLPWHHQLDVRIDRRWDKLSVFLDVANVYDHREAVGWAYNFDFTQRRAIPGPSIVPTIGVRGEL
ncbi:MAG: hypothetical protein ABI591_02500 [Kofleriaceae bacterium]